MNQEYKEYRCYISNKLLCKARGEGELEIVNPSNRVINYVGPSRVNQDIGKKGVQFKQFSVELRCKNCQKLMGRAIGTELDVEIKCHYCHELNKWELKEIYNKNVLNSISNVNREKMLKQINNF